MLQLVDLALQVGTVLKNGTYSVGKHLFVGIDGHMVVDKHLAHLQKVVMPPVVDAHDIQEARLGDLVVHKYAVLFVFLRGVLLHEGFV